MKLKDFVAKKLDLKSTSNLIILRTGGWLKDQINPAEWPGGIKAPKFEVFDPEFDLTPTKGYVEYCFTDDKDRQRLDFDISELG